MYKGALFSLGGKWVVEMPVKVIDFILRKK